MATNSSRRNARGEETLRAILGETVKLVGRNGFDGTTINQITKATGKPASSIYWLFATKDELVSAALESTYQVDLDELKLWPAYSPALSLEEQLTTILSPSFIARATEDPVRLGLMVALEGSSADSVARVPFATRRQKIDQEISAWWQSAAHHRPEVRDPVVLGENMTALTMAFLDGHYISDVDAPAGALLQEQRGEFVAMALCAAFTHMSENGGQLRTLNSVSSPQGFVVEDESETEAPQLLHAVRSLVAEKGYNGATLSRICERSGMQRSSVYWRYKDKDLLISAAVSDPFLRLADVILPSTDDMAAQLSVFARSVARSIGLAIEDQSTAIAGLLLKLQQRTPAVLASDTIRLGLEVHLEQMRAELAQSLADRGENQALAVDALCWLLHTIWQGLLLGVSFDYGYDVEELFHVLDVMLHSVANYACREAMA